MALLYTILVADDDPILLETVSQVLSEPGYTVVTARDGYEAVRILADRHIDLMITDIKMPGLSGIELAAQAKLFRPRLHIIYLSGHVGQKERAAAVFGMLIQKPVRAPDLLKAVEQEMNTR